MAWLFWEFGPPGDQPFYASVKGGATNIASHRETRRPGLQFYIYLLLDIDATLERLSATASSLRLNCLRYQSMICLTWRTVFYRCGGVYDWSWVWTSQYTADEAFESEIQPGMMKHILIYAAKICQFLPLKNLELLQPILSLGAHMQDRCRSDRNWQRYPYDTSHDEAIKVKSLECRFQVKRARPESTVADISAYKVWLMQYQIYGLSLVK